MFFFDKQGNPKTKNPHPPTGQTKSPVDGPWNSSTPNHSAFARLVLCTALAFPVFEKWGGWVVFFGMSIFFALEVQDQTKNGLWDDPCKGSPTTNGQSLVFGLPGFGWLKRRNFLSWENSLMNGAIDTSDSYKVGPYDRFKWSYEAL